MVEGISPESWFLDKFSDSNRRKDPIFSGIFPVKEFDDKFKILSPSRRDSAHDDNDEHASDKAPSDVPSSQFQARSRISCRQLDLHDENVLHWWLHLIDLLKLFCMVEDWISLANTRHRKGRAGRVNPGFCFCLYTQHRYKNLMRPYKVPEMLRMPLEELCLQIKSLSLGYIRPFLMRAIEPPQEEAIASTLSVLYEIPCFGRLSSERFDFSYVDLVKERKEIILRMPELQKGDINICIQQKQDVTKGAVTTIILLEAYNDEVVMVVETIDVVTEVVEKVAEGVEENTICLIFDHFSRFREMRGYRFVVLLIGCRTLRIS
ncbi:hypothetical protein Syun_016178 [Stephania yunnanensis]|uniref:Uncharacterized protein n=1 Tax=Stephania yunnanensis TaxID=152371 RepID=A0AAP0J726_9MAGN